MNRLPLTKRAHILGLLVEGNSLRSASRIADVSINTVTKLLVDVGQACYDYQDKHLRNLSCARIQVDEIWSFCYAKNKNVPVELKGHAGYGDVWTWTAICPDTKLVPSWMVGKRDIATGRVFMEDLAGRLKHKVQLTSDGHHAYLDLVEGAFGVDVDYAQLMKLYGDEAKPEKAKINSKYVGADRLPLIGRPDPKFISTSICERQNLTMRTNIKRFARRTNAFSKKIEHHAYAVSLHFMWYNFGRLHKTLRVTPAMSAEVDTRVWSLEDIAQMAN